MNSQSFKWIIPAMTISLLALLGIQLFWIKHSLSIEGKLFDQAVTRALQSTVAKLEERDALVAMSERIHQLELIDLMKQNDSLNNGATIDKSVKNYKYDSIIAFDDANGRTIILRDSNDTRKMETKIQLSFGLNGESVDIELEESKGNASMMVSNMARVMQFTRQDSQHMKRKSQIISKIFQDMMLKERDLFDKVDTGILEKMVVSELGNQGVSIPAELAILKEEPKQEVLFHTSGFPGSLKKGFYKMPLFPGSIFEENNEFLTIYFPGKTYHLLRSVWIMLIISGLLIIAIATGFSYTIISFLKQRKLSEMKTDFINNMTHELKTPIASISLATEALQDKSIVQDENMSGRFLGVIAKESKRLEGHVENVLRTALLDKGDFKLDLAEADMHEIIENAIQSFSLQIEKFEGVVHTDLKATNSKIVADKSHISSIIYNLIDNAIKYSKNRPEIKISTYNDVNGIFVSVEDNGIGMNKNTQKKIFEKFYRVSTGNLHDVKGFGLGLSYVKQIIDAHFGNIRVKSEPGIGSTFTIFLPFNRK